MSPVTKFMEDPTLYRALEALGIQILELQRHERTGPILFTDSAGREALLLVREEDHAEVATWHAANPNPSEEELWQFARGAIERLLAKERYEKVNAMLAKVMSSTES